MRLVYIPLKRYHVNDDNHYNLTDDYHKRVMDALEKDSYYTEVASPTGAYRQMNISTMCIVVKQEDESSVLKALYYDLHKHYVEMDYLSSDQSRWLRDNDAIPKIFRKSSKKYILFNGKYDFIKFKLACDGVKGL